MLATLWAYSDTIFPLFVLLLLVLCKGCADKKLLTVYLVLTVLVMGYSNWLADKGINNMYLYHAYTLVEALLLVPLLHGYARTNKALLGAMLVGYPAFWLVNVLLLEPVTVFNSNSATVLALLLSFLCLRYFLYLVQTDDILYFQKLSSFWIVSGLLFYSMVSILVISSYKQKGWFSAADMHFNWMIQQAANIIKFLFFSTGILCSYWQTRQAGSSL
jgi:hypothetical protein